MSCGKVQTRGPTNVQTVDQNLQTTSADQWVNC